MCDSKVLNDPTTQYNLEVAVSALIDFFETQLDVVLKAGPHLWIYSDLSHFYIVKMSHKLIKRGR